MVRRHARHIGEEVRVIGHHSDNGRVGRITGFGDTYKTVGGKEIPLVLVRIRARGKPDLIPGHRLVLTKAERPLSAWRY